MARRNKFNVSEISNFYATSELEALEEVLASVKDVELLSYDIRIGNLQLLSYYRADLEAWESQLTRTKSRLELISRKRSVDALSIGKKPTKDLIEIGTLDSLNEEETANYEQIVKDLAYVKKWKAVLNDVFWLYNDAHKQLGNNNAKQKTSSSS